jgi:hypothetical protein
MALRASTFKCALNAGCPHDVDASTGPLARRGTFAEVDLRPDNLPWYGRADLLILDDDRCEIVDFKSGRRSDGHLFQIRVYARLWARDRRVNPGGRLPTRLILAYTDGEVEVSAPTAEELDVLEREFEGRTRTALAAAERNPPPAWPTVERCRCCDVRQLSASQPVTIRAMIAPPVARSSGSSCIS